MTSVAAEKLKSKLLDLAIGLLVLVLPGMLLLIEKHLETLLSHLSLKTIVRASITLVSLLAWLFFLLWRVLPRLKFDSRRGIYKDARSNLFYCPSCHSKKLRSPLSEERHGWRCGIRECGQFYPNPDHVREGTKASETVPGK